MGATLKYVNDFTFAPSPPRPSIPGYKRGGSVSTPQPYKFGGSANPVSGTSPDIKVGVPASHGFKAKQSAPLKNVKATRKEVSSGVQKPAFAKGGKVNDMPAGYIGVDDGGWNPDDATSPGSFKRTPPGEKMKNKDAARSNFDGEGRNREPATKQKGNVERMSGFSDFRKGGKVKRKAEGGSTGDRYETYDGDDEPGHEDTSGTTARGKGDGKEYKSGGRIGNLGKYAHGGKVRSGEKQGTGRTFESKAGTPKLVGLGSKGERSSGSAVGKSTDVAKGRGGPRKPSQGGAGLGSGMISKKAGGGSAKRNAAIHAKSSHKGPSIGALASALTSIQQQPQGGATPPGLSPGAGAPPSGPPQAPTMGGGPPGMATGGGVKHVMVHHISHKM